MKKLTRSEENKIIAGVFGGLGEYLDVDPVLLRLIAIFLCFLTGIVPFVVGYIIACLVVPSKKKQGVIGISKPIYKRAWFWVIIILIIIFVLLPFVLFTTFRSVSIERGVLVENEIEYYFPDLNREKITDYLANHIFPPSFGGKIFADYYEFSRTENKMFIWAYISEYYESEGEIKRGKAISSPLVLILSTEARPEDHIEMEIGNNYIESIRQHFPSQYHAEVIDFNTSGRDKIDHMSQSTQKAAEDYFGLPFAF